MDAVLMDIDVEDPTAAAARDEEMVDGITAKATEQAQRHKLDKKSKKDKKKGKRESQISEEKAEDAMDVDPQDEEENHRKKDKKEKRDKKKLSEGHVVELVTERKKKKGKHDA
jgi:nucleolar protein 56